MKTQIRFFLEECGLTQRQLASLLLVSRSTLTRLLLGQRSLPADAELRLLQLYTVAMHAPELGDAAPATDPLPLPDPDALHKALARQALLQRRYAALQLQHSQTLQLQRWLQALHSQPQLSLVSRQQRCIAELEYQLGRKRKQLQPDMEALENELAKLASDIAALSQPTDVADTG